uniref:Putative restriction endonuclease domain-containing protein n=1 Tax=Magnetococcus massalia (strain MO-1) TaxID=451514 RepID=A0A1S7LM94_MAGMO|nr:Conserved protein of unknown function [Candidatus Magnetococcus massalia]
MALADRDYKLTEDAYLAGEELADMKHELIDGVAYAMVGASRNHNAIASNCAGELRNHLKGRPCQAFQSDFKVKVGHDFFYPDVVVLCDQDSESHDYYTESPLLIIEVLSPSTRRRDEITKLRAYQTLPSLQEYVLVSQDVVKVEVFKRQNNLWTAAIYGLGDEIHFSSVDLSLTVEEIYERVDNEEMQIYLRELEEAQKES